MVALGSHFTSLGLRFLICRMRSLIVWSLWVSRGRHVCTCVGWCSYTPKAQSHFVTTSSPHMPLLFPDSEGQVQGPPLLQLSPAKHCVDTSHEAISDPPDRQRRW